MYGGIYRLPPQPQQRRPTVPIPEQGDQPPRRNIALGMAVVLACWPTGFEHQPQQRRPTVPIPAQGDDPPRTSRAALDGLLETWRPPAPMPQQGRRDIAPLTLTYGDQPAPAPKSIQAILDQWRAADDVRQRQTQLVPIEAPAVIDDPPPRSLAGLISIIQIAWEPPPPPPKQLRRDLAPLTLTYGDQPPTRSYAGLYAILKSWLPPDPMPISLHPTAEHPTVMTDAATPGGSFTRKQTQRGFTRQNTVRGWTRKETGRGFRGGRNP